MGRGRAFKKYIHYTVISSYFSIYNLYCTSSPTHYADFFFFTDPFNMQFDLHLFSPTSTVIVKNKSRDSFRSITVTVCKNE